MKKILSSLVFILLLTQCQDDDNPIGPINSYNYRKIAYESLSQEEKENLTKCWCLAPVRIGIYSKQSGTNYIIIDDSNNWTFIMYDENTSLTMNQKLVGVILNTTIDSLVGPMILIIDPFSERVIGVCPRL